MKSGNVQTIGSPQSIPILEADVVQENTPKSQTDTPIQASTSQTDGSEQEQDKTKEQTETTDTSLNGRSTELEEKKVDENRSPKNRINSVLPDFERNSLCKTFRIIKNLMKLDLNSTKFLDYSIVVDVKNKQVLRYEVNSQEAFKLLDDKVFYIINS